MLLLGSLSDSWGTLVVTLDNAGSEGKHSTLLSLVRVKSSLLNEEAPQKNLETGTDSKALVTESETNRGRGRNRSSQNRDKLETRLKLRGRPTCFYCGPGHFQQNCRHFRGDKGGPNGAEPKKISEKRGTTAIATREEELQLITEESELHLVNDETTWD